MTEAKSELSSSWSSTVSHKNDNHFEVYHPSSEHINLESQRSTSKPIRIKKKKKHGKGFQKIKQVRNAIFAFLGIGFAAFWLKKKIKIKNENKKISSTWQQN